MCFLNEGRFFKPVPTESKQEPERMWEEEKFNPLIRDKFKVVMALESPRSLEQWVKLESKKQPVMQCIRNTP